MDPSLDIPAESTCTTCTFSEDFSDYWTPAMYFRARNGTFKRVPQMANQGFNGAVSAFSLHHVHLGQTLYMSSRTG